MTSDAEPYYFPRGDGRYESTMHAQGAWNPHEQHMAPVSGILAHSLEQFQPRPELRMARLSFDILGLIPDGEFDAVTTMLRPGRTIELVQAELVSGGGVAGVAELRQLRHRRHRADLHRLARQGGAVRSGGADSHHSAVDLAPARNPIRKLETELEIVKCASKLLGGR